MVHVYTYLLLSANYEDKKWRGILVSRGSFISGINSLSENLGLSKQSIRTCLNHLKSTGEITIKSTNKFSIITICKYDDYQIISDEANTQTNNQTNIPSTRNQQTTNKQPTTTKNIRNKEGKEFKEGKNKEPNTSSKTEEPPSAFQDCVDCYFKFIKEINGLPPKFDGAEGKALTSILKYIQGLEQVKAGGRGVVETFKFILDNYDRWSDFHKGQLKLTQINSNLTNIITSIKNGAKSKDTDRRQNQKLGEIIRSGVAIDFRPKDAT